MVDEWVEGQMDNFSRWWLRRLSHRLWPAGSLLEGQGNELVALFPALYLPDQELPPVQLLGRVPSWARSTSSSKITDFLFDLRDQLGIPLLVMSPVLKVET